MVYEDQIAKRAFKDAGIPQEQIDGALELQAAVFGYITRRSESEVLVVDSPAVYDTKPYVP